MAEAPLISSGLSGRGHRVAAGILTIAMLATALALIPFGRIVLPQNASFLPMFGAMTLICDLLTGCLLLSQARLTQDRASLRLGAAYLFSALALIPHMLAFPGVIAAESVIGASASAVWLWCFWHSGFTCLTLAFVLGGAGRLRKSDIPVVLGGMAVIILAVTSLTTAGLGWLPTILVNGDFSRLNTLGLGPVIVGLTAITTILLVAKQRLRNPLSLWLSVAMLAATLDVTLTLFGGGRFTMGWYVARSMSLVTGVTVLAALLSELVQQAGRVAQVNGRLEQLLHTDVLTGVANRRAFDRAMTAEWRRAHRDTTELSLLMIDIDQFKGFNDRYGHPAGDICLHQVASALAAQVQRPADLAARLGGEEFVLLLPNTGEEGTAQIAERVRAAVAGLRLAHAGTALGYVTVSVGAATLCPCDWADGSQVLIDAADQALYRAKSSGRNTVCTAGMEAKVLQVA